MELKRIQEQANRLGFDLVGIAPAEIPANHLTAYNEWLARGDCGEMAYMSRPDRVSRREDPSLVLPGIRSVVCVGVNYYPGAGQAPRAGPPRGRVSNHAWGQDYHDWMFPRLLTLAAFIRSEIRGEIHQRITVDTSPVLERTLASQAGLGFIGKNNCLIHPELGSWVFLGEVLVDVDMPRMAEPIEPLCGDCTLCLQACPTGALQAPYQLNARRCISYLTTEFKGSIPHDLRPLIGNWIYGCDVCQQACSYQKSARTTSQSAFKSAPADRVAPLLTDLLGLNEEEFRRRFSGGPILHIGRGRLVRNAAVALGNSADPFAIPALTAALDDPDPLVQEHALWALKQITGKS